MKKILIASLIASGIMIGIMACALIFSNKGNNTQEGRECLDLVTNSLEREVVNKDGSNHLAIGRNKDILTFPHQRKDIYNVEKSRQISNKLDKLKKQTRYTFTKPLFVWNPFGTNQLSLYYYYKDKERTYIKYTIQVEDPAVPDFTRTLSSHTEQNLTRTHEYLLTGFVPGCQNYLIIKKYNESGKLIKKEYFDFYVDKLPSSVKNRISYKEGKSSQEISEGLFCVCGYQAGKKGADGNIPFYDNSGIIRSVVPVLNYRTDRMEFVHNSMIYSYSNQGIATVSALGQVTSVYKLGQYRLCGDFIYNGYGQLWCIATKQGAKTVADRIISVEMKTGEVTELVDMGALLSKMKAKAMKAVSKKPVSKKPVNWIGLNSIDRVGSSDILVSAGELSSIMKIKSVTSGYPKLGYIISDRKIWKKSNYKKYLLLKGAYVDKKWYNLDSGTDEKEEGVHNFTCQFGQNSVISHLGNHLEEEQYFLTMLNNNYGYSAAYPNVKWPKATGVGMKGKDASNSDYYEYLVDEKAGYYGLKKSYSVPYTRKGGSSYWNGTNTIINSMNSNFFGEYDQNGKIIREYELKAYRIYKYDMKNIWYY